MGTTLEILEKLIKDDMDALDIYTHLVTGKAGGDRQSDKSISDNITNGSNRGTTKEYALRKLKKMRLDYTRKLSNPSSLPCKSILYAL